MAFRLLAISIGLLGLSASEATADFGPNTCSVFSTTSSRECRPFSGTFLGIAPLPAVKSAKADIEILDHIFEALSVLQNDYFDANFGTWPAAIDWTGAVVETIISGTLTTLTKSLAALELGSWKDKENLISFYFAQVINAFFGQDVLSIRGEAYDDILWVVLGWLEAIHFIETHATLHYPPGDDGGDSSAGRGIRDALSMLRWHGHNWVSAFAHRARVFWHLGSGGWDAELCGGGMIWNRRLQPYKNAITNELWISASTAMYEHFPGDNFTSPWVRDVPFPGQDPAHLAAAVEGYKWLKGINMTNGQGLFVDGYHISNRGGGNTKCDVRDEMVYTYNQGVILTGQRGLWTASGMPSYLQDGHELLQSVIEATGWSLEKNMPVDRGAAPPRDQLPPWRGLGRMGILEEACDASGTCSQDGQTFKGIFFHHFTAFCAPLDLDLTKLGMGVDEFQYQRVREAHKAACGSYHGWLRHNALAALETRDIDGHFGMWWGAAVSGNLVVSKAKDGIDHRATNTTDYRNRGTPQDETWGRDGTWMPGKGGWGLDSDGSLMRPELVLSAANHDGSPKQMPLGSRLSGRGQDPNDRGRGRTVETQAGGLAVLRAYWEISRGEESKS